LSLMDEVIEHVHDDLVARVQAGTTLARLSEVLGAKDQFFPVDEVVPGSTLGGAVSTGLSGPCRYLHGAVRDLVLGMTFVRADGVVVRAGSKVVKNVAGYDLAKLLTGSYGTLGVITELAIKLKPKPPARQFVTAPISGPEDLERALSALLGSQVVPTAIEVERPSPEGVTTLGVLIEGRPQSVKQREPEVASLLGSRSEVSPWPPVGWARLPGPVVLKLTSPLSAVPKLLDAASAQALACGVNASTRGSAGSGVLFMGMSEQVQVEQLAELLGGLRRVVGECGGHAIVLRAPAALKASVDVWGPVPGIELMRRIKEHLDPSGRLAPGRFVGGI